MTPSPDLDLLATWLGGTVKNYSGIAVIECDGERLSPWELVGAIFERFGDDGYSVAVDRSMHLDLDQGAAFTVSGTDDGYCLSGTSPADAAVACAIAYLRERT